MKIPQSLRAKFCLVGKYLILDLIRYLDVLHDSDTYEDEDPLLRAIFDSLDIAYCNLLRYMNKNNLN